MGSFSRLLSSKYFWYAVIALIIFFVIWKNWSLIKEKLFKRAITNYATDANGNVIPVTALDQPRIQAVMDKIEVDANDFWGGGLWASDLQPAIDFSDQELQYGANYYKQAYNTSLYSVLNSAWMPFTDSKQILMGRLQKLNITV